MRYSPFIWILTHHCGHSHAIRACNIQAGKNNPNIGSDKSKGFCVQVWTDKGQSANPSRASINFRIMIFLAEEFITIPRRPFSR